MHRKAFNHNQHNGTFHVVDNSAFIDSGDFINNRQQRRSMKSGKRHRRMVKASLVGTDIA